MTSDFTTVKFEGDRLCLPSRFAEQVRLAGDEKLECILLVIAHGRYRLLRQPTQAAIGGLAKLLHKIEDAAVERDILDVIENNAEAAIPARLIPCIASPPGPGWRINVPKEVIKLAADKEQSFVFLLIVSGFVEIWFPDALRKAVSVPISQLLP
jgi:hypothetical protein